MQTNSFQLWNRVVNIAAELPEAYEKLMFETPAFYTGKKFFCRLREDGETLVVYNNERDEWIERNPAIFFFTDHYKDYPLLLVNLKNVSSAHLEKVIINSWKIRSTKTLLRNYGK